jgi:hypothetical protein
MGQLQPAGSLSPGRLLPDAFQPLGGKLSYCIDLNVSSHDKQSFGFCIH